MSFDSHASPSEHSRSSLAFPCLASAVVVIAGLGPNLKGQGS